MPARFDLVTVDAHNSVELASFWANALRLRELETEEDADGPGRWIVLGDADGTRRLGVQRIAGLRHASSAIDGPQKSRWHLDVVCDIDEIETEIERLVAVGACIVRAVRREVYGAIATLVDPEGNIFDVCAYR